MARKSGHQPARIGRPPAGARAGEKVKDYPQLSLRLPPEIKNKLQALSIISARPQWRLISEAVECYLKERPDAERRLVEKLVRRARATARKPRRPEGK